MSKTFTYLALGDSYTIGEAENLNKSFPYQTVQLLRKKGYNIPAPEILARTGWTTDELLQEIGDYNFLAHYDFVSLLIGVNDQYRGRTVEVFKPEFETLIQKCISLANDKTDHVYLLSIPDYSVTPFAQSLDPVKTAKEIDTYNTLINALSIQYKVHFIDVTSTYRQAKTDSTLIAADKLHPSAKEYAKWAEKLADSIQLSLK